MDDTELYYHRLNTKEYIAVKPTSIVLIPEVRTKTAGGGYKTADGAPRPAQTMRIIELGVNQAPPIIRLTDGKQREADFWLLGEWNVACEIGDHWTAPDGREWEVGDIVRPNGYEMRALVSERGK